LGLPPNPEENIMFSLNNFLKFDAKSLKREDSKIVDTKGWAQSGLIFKFNSLELSAINSLYSASKHFEGSRHWTCVNANCRVLDKAGFTTGGKSFSDFYFPMPLARHIIKNGIEYDGKEIEISVIKTIPNYLESFGVSVFKSQWSTFCRHGNRYIKQKSKKNNFVKHLLELKDKLKHTILTKSKDKDQKIEDFITMFPEDVECKEDLTLLISNPSRFGLMLRLIWGPHSFFQVKQKDNNVDNYLPETLKEYDKKSPNLFTSIKKNILFSKPVIKFIRRHLAKSQEVVENNSEKELFNMIRTNTDNNPHKYNIVVTGTLITVMKVEIKYGWVDWVLSKHVLSSGYSKDVRFAGEFWKNADGIIYFNNNSGTYAPKNELLDNMENFLKQIFPNTQIKSIKANY
jgi:hypothetical protein